MRFSIAAFSCTASDGIQHLWIRPGGVLFVLSGVFFYLLAWNSPNMKQSTFFLVIFWEVFVCWSFFKTYHLNRFVPTSKALNFYLGGWAEQKTDIAAELLGKSKDVEASGKIYERGVQSLLRQICTEITTAFKTCLSQETTGGESQMASSEKD